MKRLLSLLLALIFVLSISATAMAAIDPVKYIEGTVFRNSTYQTSASKGDDHYGSIKITTLVPINGATGATLRGRWQGIHVTPAMTFRSGSASEYRYTYSYYSDFTPGSNIELYGTTPDANDGSTSYRGNWTR